MKISIIIPIYNVAEFIERSLNSALNQTYQDIEIILVDDASPDSSMEIAKKIIEKHPRKNLLSIISHAVNKGLGAARNTGVKAASGNYIFFLDSDDEMDAHCIEILASFIKDNSIDLVIGEIEVIGNKRSAYSPLNLKDGIYHGNKLIFQSFLQRKWYEMAWNKLIKRSFFIEKEIWFTEGILHEDSLWTFQLALELQSLAVIHAKTYLYHIQDNSITQKKTEKNIESFYFVLNKIIKEGQQKDLFNTQDTIYSFLENQRIFFIKLLIKNNFSKEFARKEKQRLDKLFKENVWINRQPSFISQSKEIVLSFLFAQKYS